MEKEHCVFCGSETDLAEKIIICRDQYIEYQQMAALACMSLDLLVEITNDDSITKDELVEHIKFENDNIIKMQTDKEMREDKFGIMSMLFNIPMEDNDEDS